MPVFKMVFCSQDHIRIKNDNEKQKHYVIAVVRKQKLNAVFAKESIIVAKNVRYRIGQDISLRVKSNY